MAARGAGVQISWLRGDVERESDVKRADPHVRLDQYADAIRAARTRLVQTPLGLRFGTVYVCGC